VTSLFPSDAAGLTSNCGARAARPALLSRCGHYSGSREEDQRLPVTSHVICQFRTAREVRSSFPGELVYRKRSLSPEQTSFANWRRSRPAPGDGARFWSPVIIALPHANRASLTAGVGADHLERAMTTMIGLFYVTGMPAG
jgi:hypothetical protein